MKPMSQKTPPHTLHGKEKAQYVAGMFARISRRYDLLNTVMTAGQHHRWRRLTARLAVEGLEGDAIDVATGTGDLAFSLSRRNEVSSTVGVDFVPEMVALANLKANRLRLSGQTLFLQGDALALPFQDDTFICATSGFSMRNVVDIPLAVAEMARVVKPGGRVAVMEITQFQGNGLFPKLFRFYFHRVVPLIGGLLGGDREAYTYLPHSVDLFPSAEAFASLMVQTGLKNVRYLRVGMGSVAVYVGEKPVLEKPV